MINFRGDGGQEISGLAKAGQQNNFRLNPERKWLKENGEKKMVRKG